MKLVAAKCPNCGASIEVDKDSDTTKCDYCNTKIIVEDAIEKINIVVSGNIEVKNLPKYESLVSLGDRYYNELLLREARTQYKKALELNPNEPKLIFREKICRACTASFDKTDESLVSDAFKELREKITNKDELKGYIKECSNAMAYIINKALEHYQKNNLDYYGILDVRCRISMCAIDIWYFKCFIDYDDKETRLGVLEHYIAACNLLTQDMKYKIPHTRKYGIYKVSYKDKKQYVKNIRTAEKERNELLKNDTKLRYNSNNYIQKKNYFSGEKSYIFFIILFIVNILVGIAFINKGCILEFIICLINFIYLCKKIKFVKLYEDVATKTNVIGILLLVISFMIPIYQYITLPEYVNKWKNDNMIVVIERKEAAVKFSNSDIIISGKYTVSCAENDVCKISLGNYNFEYSNNSLCYMENDKCSQKLELASEDVQVVIKKKTEICENGATPSCGEKGYYVCSDGAEHKENICTYELEKKNEERTTLIVSAIFAVCFLCFIEWVTKRR